MAKYDGEIRRDRRTHARYLRAASANRVMARQRREGLRLAWRAMRYRAARLAADAAA